jgi:hypothetical protein
MLAALVSLFLASTVLAKSSPEECSGIVMAVASSAQEMARKTSTGRCRKPI